MDSEVKISVTRTRTIKTYAELWHASWSILERGKSDEVGRAHQFLASTVLTAFAFEAYLNHVGAALFPDWVRRERSLNSWTRVTTICNHLSISLPAPEDERRAWEWIAEHAARPWKSVAELVQYRNFLAHGTTYAMPPDVKVQSAAEFQQSQSDISGFRIRDDWEIKNDTPNFAELVREDAEVVIREINAAHTGHDTYPFSSGVGLYHATPSGPPRRG